MSDLQIMFPEPVIVEIAGRAVKVYPVKLRHFELYGKTANCLLQLFEQTSVQHINQYAAVNSKQIRKLLLATTSITRWQLWRMPSSVSVQLLTEVVRVNSGFFAEALPAMVRALNGQL